MFSVRERRPSRRLEAEEKDGRWRALKSRNAEFGVVCCMVP